MMLRSRSVSVNQGLLDLLDLFVCWMWLLLTDAVGQCLCLSFSGCLSAWPNIDILHDSINYWISRVQTLPPDPSSIPEWSELVCVFQDFFLGLHSPSRPLDRWRNTLLPTWMVKIPSFCQHGNVRNDRASYSITQGGEWLFGNDIHVWSWQPIKNILWLLRVAIVPLVVDNWRKCVPNTSIS